MYVYRLSTPPLKYNSAATAILLSQLGLMKPRLLTHLITQTHIIFTHTYKHLNIFTQTNTHTIPTHIAKSYCKND